MTCGLVDDPKRDWCLTSVCASVCVISLFALSVHEPRGKRSYSGLSSRVSQTHALTHTQKNKRSPNTTPDFSICHMSVCVSTSMFKTINLLHLIDLSLILACSGHTGGQILLMSFTNTLHFKTQHNQSGKVTDHKKCFGQYFKPTDSFCSDILQDFFLRFNMEPQ